MRKMIMLFFVIFLVSCSKPITNFEECVRAGNPVLESYPMQCQVDGKTFVQEIKEPKKIILDPMAEFNQSAYDDAFALATNGECGEKGVLEPSSTYDLDRKQWKFQMHINAEFRRENCNPDCYVDMSNGSAFIEWLCQEN
jgi:hypothetical protein